MNFKVGQKIVCVTDISKLSIRMFQEVLPLKDKVYTVRELYDSSSIRLVEIVNRPNFYKQGFAECVFMNSCFKALDYNTSAVSEVLSKFKITEEKIDKEIQKEEPACS